MLRFPSFTLGTIRPLKCMRTFPSYAPSVYQISVLARGTRGQIRFRNLAAESKSSGSKVDWRRGTGLLVTALIIAAFLSGTIPGPAFYYVEPPLDEKRFKPFILQSKERVSSTSSIFSLVPSTPSGALTAETSYRPQLDRVVWSVEVKQPQLQIARAYTPLPPLNDGQKSSNSHALRFLIRHDPKGEVSSYLHKLPLGSKVELRGPHIEYKLPEDVDEVLFIAGGTGIAPALQVADDLSDLRPQFPKPPKMRILWANRRGEDCIGAPSVSNMPPKPVSGFTSLFTSSNSSQSVKDPVKADLSPLVRDLQHLEARRLGCFGVDYFVDEEKRFITEQVVRDSLQITQQDGSEAASRKKLIIVSGPEGFVNYLAGPKRWIGGREVQGDLGGLLSQIDHSGWDVWKL